MAGTMDKIKGAVKDAVGGATGDTRTQAEGKTDKAKGDVKNAAQDAKEGAKGVADSLKKSGHWVDEYPKTDSGPEAQAR